MYYWAGSTMPVYPKTRGTKPKPKPPKKKAKNALALEAVSSSSSASYRKGSSASDHHLLQPALDGPPSPERLRALSKQAKRASVASSQQPLRPTTSRESSVPSGESGDRPSWEQALEDISLSRKSSARSTSSSMPSRDRPESVQIFGKTIFNRRNRIKRESTAQSSSEGSLYSAEGAASELAGKDSVIPNIFNRRRTMKLEGADEAAAAAQKRFQISGPYNFQHVTHTQRDHLPNLERTDRNALASEFTAARASQLPSNGALRGIHADDLSFGDFSSGPSGWQEEMGPSSDAAAMNGFNAPPPALRQRQSPPRRLVKHVRSQEQLRMPPPPRPPRSPVETSFSDARPSPPPRLSSRGSVQQDDFDFPGNALLDRPQTSSGFRHVQPPPLPSTSGQILDVATPHAFNRESDMAVIPEEYLSSPGTAPSDDSNWPLASDYHANSEATLPLVPEEGEYHIASRQSQTSLASNNSSLRGSQSVPVLRQLAQSQQSAATSQRPISGQSDTLGRFDLSVAQGVLKASLARASDSDFLPRASWEDDIDYCYEHEAEADCDFEWDRPSLDLHGNEELEGSINQTVLEGNRMEESPGMLTPGRFDMPALSPASQASTVTKQEAITPTAAAIPVTSNFSMPRTEPMPQRLTNPHARTESYSSSFKEAHGFNLSPTLLIPGDFRQQMVANLPDGFVDHEELSFPYEEPNLTSTTMPGAQRGRISGTSASTTGSDSERSGMFERHISGASATTDLTRLTMSTSSLDMENYIPKHDPRPDSLVVDEAELKLASRSSGKSGVGGVGVVMPIVPESGEESSPDRAGTSSREAQRNSSAVSPGGSASGVSAADAADKGSAKRRDSLHTRRQRVRASSIPLPPPPAGQYSMFPSVKVYGTHI